MAKVFLKKAVVAVLHEGTHGTSRLPEIQWPVLHLESSRSKPQDSISPQPAL
jgi:hypothetical protein